jgi:hypothetical protein
MGPKRKKSLGRAIVKKVQFAHGRKGIGTRVVLEDGWTMTFIGPMSKAQAIKEAEWHKSRGEKSEP